MTTSRVTRRVSLSAEIALGFAAVLVGRLAARTARRAAAVERARGAIAGEQAALRRVATLVAQGTPAADLFAAVAEEVGKVLDVDGTRIARYEGDDQITLVAAWSAPGYNPPGFGRAKLEGSSISAEVLRTGRVARIDDYESAPHPAPFASGIGVICAVGAPILVEGRLWGPMVVWSTHGPLPADTGTRLTDFTELVATAIANAEARAEAERLAEEQAALRRVATLVALQSSPAEVFAAVAEELGRVLGVEDTRMIRYESDGTVTIVASWGELDADLPVGMRVHVDGENVSAIVLRTGQPARKDRYDDASGPIGTLTRQLGIQSAVGTPIIVEGRLWGAMIAASLSDMSLPAQTEARIGKFTALVATAISNIEARTALAASRARIVAATDDTRRRFERDLHDGIQQRLVLLSLEMRRTETMLPPGLEEPRVQLSRVGQGLTEVLDDLRELSRGIHPAILSEGGLGPALKALARRSAVPIKLEVSVERRLEERVEVAAYYVVSEALANAAKHAQASVAEIHVEANNGTLDVTIRDDGVGGADPERGTGLTGLTDRVEALGGTLAILSPDGAGTSLRVQLPVGAA